MTTKEKIEYLAKAVMTLSELGDGKTAYVLNEIRLEMKSQLELPDGLEEAAWDCVLDSVDVNNPVLLPKYKELLTYLFIAGAEWMAAQGVNHELEVKADAGGYPYIDKTFELYDYTADKPIFNPGDKVIVNIRKKED